MSRLSARSPTLTSRRAQRNGNIGFRSSTTPAAVATAKWHYVKLDATNPDLTKACFGKPALPSMAPASRGVQDDCVVDKIEQFAKELRDPATLPGERLTALQFLLNFVGDVNDPLF